MPITETHFCSVIDLPPHIDTNPTETQTRGFVVNAKRWTQGEEIPIAFLDGDQALRDRVEAVAREWLQYAQLTFQIVEAAPQGIRISFATGPGSWSYIGTDCRDPSVVDPAAATMNYGWLTPASLDDELRRVVLHEFGHALGMIHEHQNPLDHAIRWNEMAVLHDLSGPPNNWSDATIRSNIFAKYDKALGTGTDFDPASIMLYPVPASWTENGYFSAGLNSELSDMDKLLIKQIYSR